MRHVTVRLTAHDVDPETAYQRIRDFRRYPEVTETVREVVVHPPHDDGTVVSDWTVRFRNGLMRWSERDAFFPKTRTIGFTQLTGDFELFEGTWRCASGEDGTAVTFDAVFDLGIPTLAELLDPVADSTLRSNIERILRGLLGRVTPAPAQLADSVAPAHG
ncbi:MULTISPECIES: type II toxin-antitoxin system RatA family toxin [Streptomyces]|jgi:ribosome-associated toxin RatA of RatAB toxin-antitoxin module|uniref:Ribosome association toxin PasT (RatA) of the RatAB toxin-antitoxin module n=1 Tax=Streptomyces mirabilis TaxID=68239 RepID=A0A1I2LRR7_9ACTN|nr:MULTISPECIES: SRPBCC family protein [Streptomyces]KPI09609.1 cyclase/dehydrase [Actinobacteria bacterium OK006]KAF5993163.1 cyclase [Streptomyces sp. WAC00263]MCT9105062.1 SRPBCC family protein [Streptomyces mirabilis]MCX4419660.1 SRPBCC family protein [Streptomyces mirabilis]MCX4613758.1 SRPBCC family protein [Streptomyces mirabilis]